MKTRKGFTIVELVVVIAVVAILAAVLIPSFSGVVEKTDRSTALKLAEAAYKEAKAQALEDNNVISQDEEAIVDGFKFRFSVNGESAIVILYPSTFKYYINAITADEIVLGDKRTDALQPDSPITPIDGDTIKLYISTLEIEKGQREVLYASVSPANATNYSIEWSSNAPSVATVDPVSGLVVAEGEGSATVTATLKVNGVLKDSATCTVTVKPISVNFVSLNSLNLSFTMGDVGRQLTATVKPDNAANKTIYWTSTNSNVVTVDNGFVDIVGPGYAEIIATTANNITAKCGITVNGLKVENNITIVEGSVFTIPYVAYPVGAVDWSVVDGDIVNFDIYTERFTALKEGTTKVTAKINGFEDECTITVIGDGITDEPIAGITLDKTSAYVAKDGTLTLAATAPTGSTITWASSEEAIATVENGVVTGVSVGTATITATMTGDGDPKTADCIVTVYESAGETGYTVAIEPESVSMIDGGTTTLTANVNPPEGTYTIVWTSSNAAVATVGNDGVVTAIKPGTATITAAVKITETIGETQVEKIVAFATRVVTVNAISVTVEIDSTYAAFRGATTVASGNEYTALVVAVDGYEIEDIDVEIGRETAECTYNPETGVLTIAAEKVKGGDISISIRTKAKEQVIIPVEGIALTKETISLESGNSETIGAIVAPDNATDKSVIWTSSNINVASVSASGVVTAHNSGTATITAKTSNGLTASCTVTVTGGGVAVTDISIPDVEVNVGETVTIVPTFTPADATNTNVVWKSFNPAVATVDSYGVVTGHSVGTAIITAMSIDGGDIGGACTVTVTASSDVGGGAGSGDVTDSDDVESKTIVDVIVADESIQYIEVANPSEAFAGENYNLIVNAKDGYIITDIVVKDNGHPVGSPASYSQTQTFELGNIVGPITITATVTENLLKTSNGAGEAGYIEHSYLDSGGNAALLEGVFLSGYIDVRYVNSVNIINIDLNSSSTEPKRECDRIAFYDDSFNPLANCCYMLCEWLSHQSDIQFIYENENMVGFAKKGKTQNAAYFRISSAQIGEDSVIYAN